MPSSKICIACGACCRNFPYVQLTQNDIDRLESFTGFTPKEFVSCDEKDGENRFIKFKENGECVFLNNTDGHYTCGVYQARPEICSAYPWTDTQDTTCRKLSNREIDKPI